MKKSLALIAVCLAVVLLLAGCAGKQAEKGSVPGQTKDTAEPTKIEEGEAEETEDKAADAEAAVQKPEKLGTRLLVQKQQMQVHLRRRPFRKRPVQDPRWFIFLQTSPRKVS